MWHGKGQFSIQHAFSRDDLEDISTKEDLETTARRELGETPEVKQKSLEQLRQLLQGEEDLRIPPDDVLVMFLRAKKYRVEDAFKTTRKYLRVRRDMPEYYDNLTPQNIPYKTFFNDHGIIMFGRHARGRAVGYLRLGKWNTDICTIGDLMRCTAVAVESNLREEETQVHGFVAIIDLEGFGFHQLIHMTPRFVRRVATIAQVHFLAGDISELHEVVPPELILKEFGGTQEDYDFDAQEKFFHSKTDYFETMLQCGYPTK
ncbi:retinaldehyde-binding protein 1-like isoform X2 [Amblyomma americanum]